MLPARSQEATQAERMSTQLTDAGRRVQDPGVVDDEPSIVDACRPRCARLRRRAGAPRPRAIARGPVRAGLVVLDWMLPDIEGIEVGRRIRTGLQTAIPFSPRRKQSRKSRGAAGRRRHYVTSRSPRRVVARVAGPFSGGRGDLRGRPAFADLVLDEGRSRGVARMAAELTGPSSTAALPHAQIHAASCRRGRSSSLAVRLRRQHELVETYVSYLPPEAGCPGAAAIKTVRRRYMLEAISR